MMARKDDKGALVTAVETLFPMMKGQAGKLSIPALKGMLSTAQDSNAAAVADVPEDGPITKPVRVGLTSDKNRRFVEVAVERYRGAVNVGLRRGWYSEKHGQEMIAKSEMKTTVLHSRDQVDALIAALTEARKHIS